MVWSEVAISHESVGKPDSSATAGRLRLSRVGFGRNRWFGRIDWAWGYWDWCCCWSANCNKRSVVVLQLVSNLCASLVECGGCCHCQIPQTSFRRLLVQTMSRNRIAEPHTYNLFWTSFFYSPHNSAFSLHKNLPWVWGIRTKWGSNTSPEALRETCYVHIGYRDWWVTVKATNWRTSPKMTVEAED